MAKLYLFSYNFVYHPYSLAPVEVGSIISDFMSRFHPFITLPRMCRNNARTTLFEFNIFSQVDFHIACHMSATAWTVNHHSRYLKRMNVVPFRQQPTRAAPHTCEPYLLQIVAIIGLMILHGVINS